MVPPVIVERALAAGLRGIAICDHNGAANVPAVREAGAEAGLAVIPGMEVTTAEEIHLLALFDAFRYPHVQGTFAGITCPLLSSSGACRVNERVAPW